MALFELVKLTENDNEEIGKLKKIFERIDDNHSSKITENELARAFEKLNVKTSD